MGMNKSKQRIRRTEIESRGVFFTSNTKRCEEVSASNTALLPRAILEHISRSQNMNNRYLLEKQYLNRCALKEEKQQAGNEGSPKLMENLLKTDIPG